MVFETFSLLATIVINKLLHTTFSISNARSTVALAEDEFLFKFSLVLLELDEICIGLESISMVDLPHFQVT